MSLKYFSHDEFDCKCGCGKNNINLSLLMCLDKARDLAGIPFVITSGCRCSFWNDANGGSPNSAHMGGMAADIAVPNSPARFKILKSLIEAGFLRIGVAKDFIHVDIDGTKPVEVCWMY